MITRTFTRSLLLTALAASLHACGGNDSAAPADDTVQLQGVVAVGDPVVGAAVTFACSTPLTLAPITSGTGGAWNAAVPPAALPCAVQASGGTAAGTQNAQTLHSLALAAGTVNITPLTDLLLAAAVRLPPDAWFAAVTLDQLAAASQAAAEAKAAITQALQTAGYALPSGFSPLDMTFSARAGDPYDDLLEAFNSAIAAAGTSYGTVLAQWAAATGSPPALPGATLASGGAGAGNGAALGGGDGATATVGGTVYTRTANVGWAVFPGQTIGTFDAAGGTDEAIEPLQRWVIRNLPATVGTHACAGATGLNIQLQDGERTSSTAPSGGDCRVEVLEVAANAVTGRFAGTLIDVSSGTSSPLQDGFFRLAVSTGGGELPAGETGLSFTVNGTAYGYGDPVDASYEDSYRSYTFVAVQALPGSDGGSSPGYPLGIQIHTLPQAVGTYACDQQAVPSVPNPGHRKVNVWFWWNGEWYRAGNRGAPEPGPAGSSCTITLTDVTSSIAGTFSGVFVSDDLSRSVTVSNGMFRAAKRP